MVSMGLIMVRRGQIGADRDGVDWIDHNSTYQTNHDGVDCINCEGMDVVTMDHIGEDGIDHE